jgi:hypothetical protein
MLQHVGFEWFLRLRDTIHQAVHPLLEVGLLQRVVTDATVPSAAARAQTRRSDTLPLALLRRLFAFVLGFGGRFTRRCRLFGFVLGRRGLVNHRRIRWLSGCGGLGRRIVSLGTIRNLLSSRF